jgi:hypothetical protein
LRVAAPGPSDQTPSRAGGARTHNPRITIHGLRFGSRSLFRNLLEMTQRRFTETVALRQLVHSQWM